MKAFRSLSQIFATLAVAAFIYELAYQWVVHARFKFRGLGELFNDMADIALADIGIPEKFLAIPAPLSLLMISVVSYVLFFVLTLATGKDRSHRL